jgi:hypothetical protein
VTVPKTIAEQYRSRAMIVWLAASESIRFCQDSARETQHRISSSCFERRNPAPAHEEQAHRHVD